LRFEPAAAAVDTEGDEASRPRDATWGNGRELGARDRAAQLVPAVVGLVLAPSDDPITSPKRVA
jgi:hypothetical protein